MRYVIVSWLLLLAPTFASAHEGEGGHEVRELAAAEGVSVEGTAIVAGTVASLKPRLWAVERWPELFPDARSVVPGPDAWSFDFVRFGHPHAFRVIRGPRSVSLELAEAGHGTGGLVYALEPLDATRSILRVRITMGIPPGFTREATVALLRGKIEDDLAAFARR